MSGVGAPESTSTLASPSQSAWATIKEAIRGSRQDFTEAPVATSLKRRSRAPSCCSQYRWCSK
jgi:hypothetical protein